MAYTQEEDTDATTRHAITEAGAGGIEVDRWDRLDAGTLVRVIHSGNQALNAVMLEMGQMVAGSVVLMEQEEIAWPEYDPTDPAFQKWVHEAGLIYLGDQKVLVTRPRLRHIEQGEVTLQFYAPLRNSVAFSEELAEVTFEQYCKATRRERFLDEMNRVVPWVE